MSDSDFPTPEINVLLIASHVVSGYVGNKTAAYVMQALGCNVSALNTVHFTNHTGYKNWKGTKLTGDEIRDIYTGLKENDLADYDMMLTGYCPGAEAVEAAGYIARDLKYAATTKPGSFFWVLDPVMGDNGRLYVDPSVVPVYKSLIDHADLIMPNQFELETLSDVKVDSFATMLSAIETLHKNHRTTHILITSVRLPGEEKMSVIGSTRTSDFKARAFRIEIPIFDAFFSGTGDLLASLTSVRMREAAIAAGVVDKLSWLSPDSVDSLDLPLAKAAEKALSSTHAVLEKTMKERDSMLRESKPTEEGGGPTGDDDKKSHLKLTKASEVRLVRNVSDLLHPKELFKIERLDTQTLPQKRQDP